MVNNKAVNKKIVVQELFNLFLQKATRVNNDGKLSKEQCLDNYLKCEEALKSIFDKLTFCKDHAGKVCNCCKNDLIKYYYNRRVNEVLNTEREQLYGKGNVENSQCRYLNNNGCILKTHKPPICIAYACKGLIDELKSLGINYSTRKIESVLIDVLF